ncbi:MAG TPA: hypothetical protein VKB31_04405 [Trueperaceae bacterium]|nr:hypothetical protein [Trueperaceae bacterium]
MPRSILPPLAVIAVLAFAVLATADAAQPLDLGSEAGVMVKQAVHTLGGTFVACGSLATGALPSTAQVACARLPGDMFGYFEMGVHGRLYEYLARGTLHVSQAWHSAGAVLEVVYRLARGTLTVERERAGNALYGIFAYQSNAGYASASAAGH